MYLGSFEINDLCTFYVNSHTPATGAAVDADADPGYRVYEEETGTPILTGSMAKLDDSNTTGFYSEQITLSAANGFEAGKSYCVRITLVVGGVTGTVLHTLQMASLIEAGLSPRQAQRLIAAASAGKISGADTTEIIVRNAVADSKDRITATVDANGNRSAITVDLT